MVKPYLNLRLDECIIALKDLVKDMLDSDIKIARLNQQKWKKTVLFF